MSSQLDGDLRLPMDGLKFTFPMYGRHVAAEHLLSIPACVISNIVSSGLDASYQQVNLLTRWMLTLHREAEEFAPRWKYV